MYIFSIVTLSYTCNLRYYYLSVHVVIGTIIFLCSDWRYNEDCTLPDSIGCQFKPNSYNAKAALCGCQDPWRLERPSLSFGLQVLRRFQASSGPLGGIVALLESTFESQGDIPWKNHRLSNPDQPAEASRTSVPLLLREINILELLLYLFDLSPI